MIRNVRTRGRIDSSSIVTYSVNFDPAGYYARTRCILTLSSIIDIEVLYESIGNTENHVVTLTCLEWHCENMLYIKHPSCILIDNVGDYVYVKNQRMRDQIWNWSPSVQAEIVPYFKISFKCLKKYFQKFYDWLANWLITSGYMDLRRPRVYQRSNVGLVKFGKGLVL